MRTQEQIERIQKTHSEPLQFQNIVSAEQIEELKTHFYNSQDVIQKNTGPKVLYIDDHPFVKHITQYLQQFYLPFKVRSAHIFEVSRPHVVHIDDDFKYPDIYKGFVIPLETVGAPCDRAKFVVFDQYYYNGPAKFFKGEKEDFTEVYYNENITDYTDVYGTVTTEFPQDMKVMLLNHLKPEWLEGLSISAYFPWTIGSVISFDSSALHSASDFTRAGITKKLGLSIFTELDNGTGD